MRWSIDRIQTQVSVFEQREDIITKYPGTFCGGKTNGQKRMAVVS